MDHPGRILAGIAMLLAGAAVQATTWAEARARDPVSGRVIQVREPASYGSYIYEWPGKEDQVFWPFTDEEWLWFNPKTGYGAFGDDFRELQGDALRQVKAWLAANYDPAHPPRTRLEKLAWLEQLYAQRGMSDDFWCYYYRLMAYEHAEANPARSLEYVRIAVPLIKAQLARAQDGHARIPPLYLLGEYHRRLGEAGLAKDFFAQARTTPFQEDDGTTRNGSEYFNALMDERQALSPPRVLPKRRR